MIDIMLRGIVGNTNRIEAVTQHIIENEKKNSLMFSILLVGGYLAARTISRQDKRIRSLEEKLKDIKTKGE